eukprot:Blabericola_migrator_1__5422@NODE_2774_length_2370_cov_109_268780_g1737_i0_p3_GENE_NODE_2774_length_2370_cov_109_268780_g1737_i0NODE_2774_length_2370_cov_109_268780_g1737_i0_p3_ORF_typecomplete_len103_score13_74DPM2/PF07297_12/6_6e13PIGP/PF08510_12/0_048ABC_export/PF16962_5/0_057_NODE_2774_length_2370_cov_109_268780_g1737_i0566874
MHKSSYLFIWIATLAYYSFWILVSPFLDEDQPLQRMFPPRKYGVLMSDMWVSCLVGFCIFLYGWYVYFGDRKYLFGSYSVECEIAKRNQRWLELHKEALQGY